MQLPGGSALLIDESYNANPASMAAAIALLGQADVGPQGRRIAVLGDMLELGDQGEPLHRALAQRSRPPRSIWYIVLDRRCIRCGRLFPPAAGAAMPRRRRSWSRSVLDAIRAGDAVMVKGSLGSKMGPIVKALERQYPGRPALEQAQI